MSESLAASVAAGDPLALARAISLIEDGSPKGEKVLAGLFPLTGRASVIGVTGPPGVGKSTLVNRLVSVYRARGCSLGVVAVDPSSAFSGGAVLGDRIRMQEHTLDPEVFIRSMASRGHFGGLSRASRDAVDLIDASGRDPILLETVGVGQDEIDIIRAADTILVILTPGQGDDIQAIKAGILEIADLFVINKAEQPGADRLASDLEGMLALGEERSWRPPILRTTAHEGRGIEELVGGIDRHTDHMRVAGTLAARRRSGLAMRFQEILRDRLMARLSEGDPGVEDLVGFERRVMEREIDPYSATRQLLERLDEREARTGGSATAERPADDAEGAILDHLGVAVRSVEERVGLYRDLLGLELLGIETVEGEQVRVAMLPAGRTRVELVEPMPGESTVSRFIEKRGEGIHHICFQVNDLSAAVARFRQAGLAPAGVEGRAGAEGSRIAFIHPKGTGGILIELRETRRTAPPRRSPIGRGGGRPAPGANRRPQRRRGMTRRHRCEDETW
jgi:LAO/AO transport system kinase